MWDGSDTYFCSHCHGVVDSTYTCQDCGGVLIELPTSIAITTLDGEDTDAWFFCSACDLYYVDGDKLWCSKCKKGLEWVSGLVPANYFEPEDYKEDWLSQVREEG
jgi:hypothetical protein